MTLSSAVRVASVTLLVALATSVAAQTTTAGRKDTPRGAARAAAQKSPPVTPAGPSGKGWRIGQRPAWVVEPPVGAPDGADRAPGGGARRELLVDVQYDYTGTRPQVFVRQRSVAADASALGPVSQPQIRFQPAYQEVILHEAVVVRDGRRVDRLGDARVELLRREQRLDQQIIDGSETLLVILQDVRVGEPVEISYSVVGENPIHEGRIATSVALATDAAIDVLHFRLQAPLTKPIKVIGIATDLLAERHVDGSRQVFTLVRRKVAPVVPEQGVPPWFKVYPALQVTEYRDWGEVDAWARRLFETPSPAAPAVVERIEAFRATGLQGEALVSEVLRFVQDEIRYFSVSLGESSHRPKPADRTLAERFGDCKDKVVLLNALLGGLGFDVRPALVSMARNRGLDQYAPTHEEFDHVVTRLVLNGTTYYLDPTVANQGTTLSSRGFWRYGRALVVGGGGELVEVVVPAEAQDALEFEQHWDLSTPGEPASLRTVLRGRGSAAERWRTAVATVGLERVAEAIANVHARAVPNLKPAGGDRLHDDRAANVLEIVQHFNVAQALRYSRGVLELEIRGVGLTDALAGPPEAVRRTPFLLDMPKRTSSLVTIVAPRDLGFASPPRAETNDRHFRFTYRAEVSGRTLTIAREIERRADEVLPSNMESFRQNLLKARQMTGGQVRMNLVDQQTTRPDLERIVRRLKPVTRGLHIDALLSLLMRHELDRLLDTRALERIAPGSLLAARVLASRARSTNLLGDFEAALADADASLAIDANSDTARDARAVALVGLGRVEEAIAEFQTLATGAERTSALKWLGAVLHFLGRHAEAEAALRQAIDSASGEDSEFAKLWLYLAAEAQGGRGKAAIAPYVDAADAKKLTGVLLRYLAGRIDRDALLGFARESSDMARLNLAEAYFFVGQQLLAQGHRDEALTWLQRVVETQAVPYREFTFAKLELRRAAGR